MELTQFIALIKKNTFLLVTIVVLSIGAACAYSYYQSLFFEGVFIFSVQRIEAVAETPVAGLDGYYFIESARLFGRRLGNLLALKKGAFAKPFEIKQLSDFDYKISVKAKTEPEIRGTITALESAAAADLENLSFETGEYAAYSVAVSEIQIAKKTPDYFLRILISAIAGLLFGIFAALFGRYINE
ncbi:MAG: hypothetical protein AAB851_00335 [Patescibacteria group bacterium]